MFTRTVEVTTKPGKTRELTTLINDKVLPILTKQAGFVDETVLVSDTEPNRGLAISFWNTKEDAERYHKEQYPAIREMIRPLLDAEPVVRTFNVESSTTPQDRSQQSRLKLGRCLASSHAGEFNDSPAFTNASTPANPKPIPSRHPNPRIPMPKDHQATPQNP